MLFNAIVSQNLITTKEFIDFAVSKEIKYLTATRDLKELEQLEYIKVVHDHIEISNASLESPMHSYRYVLNVEEKTKIAARAVEFLEEEDVVYISSGTTCEWLVKQIKTDVALVVTNGLAVFNTCLNNEHIKENNFIRRSFAKEDTRILWGRHSRNFIALPFYKSFSDSNKYAK
jgi:DeoR/GlpR family transcriptional regulator of sugar metabolism